MEQLGPIYVTLNRIQEAKEGPRERLGEMTKSLPLINSIVARLTGCKEQCDHLRDSVAVVLRGICLDAWNTHQDIGTALAANRQAVQFAVGQELAQRLQDDQTALDRIVRDRIRAAEREEVTKLLSEINRSGVEPPPKKERRI